MNIGSQVYNCFPIGIIVRKIVTVLGVIGGKDVLIRSKVAVIVNLKGRCGWLNRLYWFRLNIWVNKVPDL